MSPLTAVFLFSPFSVKDVKMYKYVYVDSLHSCSSAQRCSYIACLVHKHNACSKVLWLII